MRPEAVLQEEQQQRRQEEVLEEEKEEEEDLHLKYIYNINTFLHIYIYIMKIHIHMCIFVRILGSIKFFPTDLLTFCFYSALNSGVLFGMYSAFLCDSTRNRF